MALTCERETTIGQYTPPQNILQSIDILISRTFVNGAPVVNLALGYDDYKKFQQELVKFVESLGLLLKRDENYRDPGVIKYHNATIYRIDSVSTGMFMEVSKQMP